MEILLDQRYTPRPEAHPLPLNQRQSTEVDSMHPTRMHSCILSVFMSSDANTANVVCLKTLDWLNTRISLGFFFPTAYEVWRNLLFSQACVIHSVRRGGGSPFFHSVRGVFRFPQKGRGVSHFPQGGCLPFFTRSTPNTGISSMHGRYASYLNAYLLIKFSLYLY